MKLKQLVRALNVRSVKGSLDVRVQGVTCDSRQVRPGFIFVAVSGSRQDGWLFSDDADKRGAAAIVSEHPPTGGCKATLVEVEDARLAAAALAAEFHGHPSQALRTIGITGTNGKTTIAYLVRDMLTAEGTACGLISTVEYEIGARRIRATRTTPDAPDLQSMLAHMVQAGCQAVVMEVSSHALVQKRVTGIDYDVAVFTNLTHDHLDYHGSMDAYFDAKSRLFTGLGHGTKPAIAVVNIDDPYGRELAARTDMKAEILTYGLTADADVHTVDLALTAKGSRFRMASPWGEVSVVTSLLGRFNVSNILAATAVCGVLQVPVEAVARALKRAGQVPGRLERIDGPGFQIYVDYAHTDDALGLVLRALREVTTGRLIVVFGCGGDRDRAKRPLMGRVAATLADRVVITSDNPRSEDPAAILADIREGIPDCGHCEFIEDRREAIAHALAVAGPDDVVLVAGKGHENFQELANRTIAFDDRQVVRDLLGIG